MDKGVNWPKDISIVQIGTPEWNGMLRPPLTCVRRPEREMGRATASLLLGKMQDPNSAVVQQVFPCALLEGNSVRNIS
jgi:LacI family transcriptional regulator